VPVEQRLAAPALQQNHPVGVVHALEQLVLLEAFLRPRDRLQRPEGADKVNRPARRNLHRDNVPNGHIWD